jgi:type II secretion system protein C
MSSFDSYRKKVDHANQRLSRAAVAGASAAVAAVTLWVSGFRVDMIPELWGRSQSRPPAVSTPKPAVTQAVPPKVLQQSASSLGVKSSISPTPQRLVLTGTLLGRNSHEGQAFIGIDARNPQTYSAGALLANGAELTEIFKDYVVLHRDGRSVHLYVQGASAPGSSAREDDDLLMVGRKVPAKPAAPSSWEVYTDYIVPNPVYDGSVLRGYEVYPGKHAAVFARMGLRTGDLMTSIEGMPLADPSQVQELFRGLARGNSMTALVSREGKIQSLVLDGSFIVTEEERAKQPPTSASMANTPAM